MKIYGDAQSGNCYKIQLLAHHLDIAHTWVPINILEGDTQTSEFLAMNPAGKIPLLELDDGRHLSESNAILHYLANGSWLLPENTWLQAVILSWQFFEQYSHEPNIAVARFINVYLGMPEDRKADYQEKQTGGNNALAVMEAHLNQQPFFAGNNMSIADISLYAYTHVAHEGGFDLSNYSAIGQWLTRISEHPKHLPMQKS
ncbi:MAG: glutathione S-transferase family protein [Granulosicoccaceae bacterium]